MSFCRDRESVGFDIDAGKVSQPCTRGNRYPLLGYSRLLSSLPSVLLDNVLTAHSSLSRVSSVGTSTYVMPPVVGILFLVSFPRYFSIYLRLTFIGAPQVGPGSTLPPKSTPSPSPSGSKAGPIAGGIVGGIAVITLLVAALFYRQRRRSRASSAALPAANSAGDEQSAVVAFNSPMLSRTPSQASSGGNPYTVSPVPAPQSHG